MPVASSFVLSVVGRSSFIIHSFVSYIIYLRLFGSIALAKNGRRISSQGAPYGILLCLDASSSCELPAMACVGVGSIWFPSSVALDGSLYICLRPPYEGIMATVMGYGHTMFYGSENNTCFLRATHKMSLQLPLPWLPVPPFNVSLCL